MNMKTFTYQVIHLGLILSGTACAVVTDPGEVVTDDGAETPETGTSGGGTDEPDTGGTTGQSRAETGGSPAGAAGGTDGTGGETQTTTGGAGSLPPVDNGPAKSCVASGNPGDVLLFDDFENGSGTWFTNEEIFWQLSTDESQVFEQAYTTADDVIVAAGGCTQWANVLVEARVKMTGGSDSDDIAAVFVRLTDANNFYYVALQGDGTLKLKKRVDGSNSSIGTTYSDTVLEQNVWYTLGIEAVGSELNMYLDGVLVDRADEPGKFSASDTDLSAGLAGFGTLGAASAMFDDITVTQR